VKVDAVLPAGGRVPTGFAREAGAEIKALIPFGRRTILERVLRALRDTDRIRRIVLIGPDELRRHDAARAADAALPEVESGIDNIYRGLERLKELNRGQYTDRVLIMTTDLPFAAPGGIVGFLDACPSESDICLPLISRMEFQERFPGAPNFFVHLRDGDWTIGCTFLVNPETLARSRPTVEDAFAARKNPIAMARLLGLMFVLRYVAGGLTIAQIERRCLEITGCTGTGVRGCAPELSFDIDRLDEFRYAIRSGNWEEDQ